MKVDEIKSKTSEAVSYRGQRQALVGTMRVTAPPA